MMIEKSNAFVAASGRRRNGGGDRRVPVITHLQGDGMGGVLTIQIKLIDIAERAGQRGDRGAIGFALEPIIVTIDDRQYRLTLTWVTLTAFYQHT